MTALTARAISRRRVLSSGLAVLGATILVPGFARSGPSQTFDFAKALAFDGSAILAATPDGLLRHEGESWTTLGALEPPNTLSTHPSRPGVIHAGWQDGSLRHSDDSGASWTAADAGLPGAPILSLTMAAQSPGILYASIEGDGLWRSEDDGQTWAFVMGRPYLDGTEHDVLSLLSVSNETGMGGIWLYAGTQAGLTRVPDCFCRWQDVVAGDAMDALVAGNAPTDAETLPAGEPVEILALAPEAPKRILAALPSGLWLSTDAGVNWARATSEPATALAVDPADPLHVIAADPSGLRVSRDGGSTWTSFDQPKDS